MHIQALRSQFMDPWILREYCINSVWGTGTEGIFGWLRNRVYVMSTGMETYDAHLKLNNDTNMFQTGLYTMHDTTKGTRSLP